MTVRRKEVKMLNNFFGSPTALFDSLYGNFRTRTFAQIWDSVEDFLADYQAVGIKQTISTETATNLYYLLYARYGNSNIASSDENQFKYKLFSVIFMYGPTWEKRLEIQENVRSLTEDELRESAKAIYNHSFNPSTAPSTDTIDELPTINDQNVTKHRRSKTDGYALLMSLLETDVTAEFLDRFKKLFITVVEPELPLWYVTDLMEDQA